MLRFAAGMLAGACIAGVIYVLYQWLLIRQTINKFLRARKKLKRVMRKIPSQDEIRENNEHFR